MSGNPGLWLLTCAVLTLTGALVGDVFNPSSPGIVRVSFAAGLLAGAVTAFAFALWGLL